MATIQKRKVCNIKKCKWNNNYIAYGFYCTKEEALNPYPLARYLFCTAVFGNNNLTPGHLQRYLKTNTLVIKINQWRSFESCLQNHLKQLSLFENNMAKERNNDLVLASFQMAHVITKRKCPYTELESVVLPVVLKLLLTLCMEGKKLSQK